MVFGASGGNEIRLVLRQALLPVVAGGSAGRGIASGVRAAKVDPVKALRAE